MVLNTLTVGAAVTPTVTKTWISHYLNRKPLRTKPTAHISYDLGLHLVRRFVEYSALHTVEELQAFTGQWVPAPSWVKTEDVEIDSANITKAAEYIQAELGPDGIEQVGGKEWWQWRRDNQPLKAEWIEMKADYHERKAGKERGNRVMLYVHGGAYYFGSVNEHRYQIQRHARKLKARCLAPRYRLAPQFPFPCGLHDCLAAYLYLLGRHDHTEIIVAGDSAGGGMALALLVVLRDRGLPLPAGGILLSPWVDLMHSFPSICGSAELDYIPGDGFMHKPSMGWPPPSLEDVHDELVPSGAAALKTSTNGAIGFSVDDARKADTKVPAKDRERGYSVTDPAKMPKSESSNRDKRAQENCPDMLQSNITEQPEPSSHLPAVMVDGQLVQIRDQIQLYSPNHLLQHPLVSPVLQPSLGGLPPILIQIGGGELLRDEQVYLAHKMANPSAYPPRKEILNRYDPDRTAIDKYKPTNVQVQLWEDMCHVGHTLSFTRPAKFMYRSVAQFGAWALAHAQGRSIDIPIDDQSDTDSVSSQEESDEGKKSPIADASATIPTIPTIKTPANGTVGKAGDPLPPFVNNMIRQRVDRHGDIYDLPPIEDIPVLHIDPEEIGILKEGPVKKWLQRQQKWNKKFATTKRELQKKRAKQLAKGYVGLPQGEKPPPTALAGMRTKDLPKVGRVTTSWGMMMWSGWGSKHDEVRVQNDVHEDKAAANLTLDKPANEEDENLPPERETISTLKPQDTARPHSRSRSHSRSRTITDEGQANGLAHVLTTTILNRDAIPAGATIIGNTVIPPSDTTSTRPTADGIAYPFKLKVPDDDMRSTNASMMTLESADELELRVRPKSVAPSGLSRPLEEKVSGLEGKVGSPNGTPGATPVLESPRTGSLRSA